MLEVPDDWSNGQEGLSSDVTDLLAGLDQDHWGNWSAVASQTERRQFSKLGRVEGPRGSTCYYYCQHLRTGDPGCISVFLEDRVTGALTQDPIHFCSLSSFYEFPQPRFLDLDGDGVEELITEDFFHNGTALNLYVDTYWSIAPDLSAQPVLMVARGDAGIRVEPSVWGTVLRRLRRVQGVADGESLLVEVVWEPQLAATPERILGQVHLDFDAAARTWHAGRAVHQLTPPWNALVVLADR